MLQDKVSVEEKSLARVGHEFGQFATTVERVGVPVAALVIGAGFLYLGVFYHLSQFTAWFGAILMSAAFSVSVWLTLRSMPPPRAVPLEFTAILQYLQEELSKQTLRNEGTGIRHQPITETPPCSTTRSIAPTASKLV